LENNLAIYAAYQKATPQGFDKQGAEPKQWTASIQAQNVTLQKFNGHPAAKRVLTAPVQF
jgi:hypothetical protein